MKTVALALLVFLGGCSSMTGGSDGNPNDVAYAGTQGSVYDSSANPPAQVGTVTYDENAAQKIPDDVIPAPNPAPVSAR